MTNPGNIVRIRSRNGGRASVYESNMWAQKWQGGLFSGLGVTQNTSADMNVLVGGSTTNPDVVIAQNAAGYNIALDIVGKQAVLITKPAANSRISSIVAYTNDLSLSSTDTTTTGSPSSCGLIVVNGATSATPVAPTDTEIRTAITADGATGSQATYCVIASITVASTTTTITNTLISIRKALLTGDKINFATIVQTERRLPASNSSSGYSVASLSSSAIDGSSYGSGIFTLAADGSITIIKKCLITISWAAYIEGTGSAGFMWLINKNSSTINTNLLAGTGYNGTTDFRYNSVSVSVLGIPGDVFRVGYYKSVGVTTATDRDGCAVSATMLN
jgi:hypothetical protein